MAKKEIKTSDNLIPVRSEEAGVIIRNLFNQAIDIFREFDVDIPLNERMK